MKDILVIDDFISWYFDKATTLVQCNMDVYMVFTK